MKTLVRDLAAAAAVMAALVSASFAAPPADEPATIADVDKALAPIIPKIVPEAAQPAEPAADEAPPPKMNDIAGKMEKVVGDLALKETGEPVQIKEQAVVKDLDVLIAALEKQCEKCKGNRSKNNPKTPLPDSIIKSGTGGVGDLVDPGQSEKDWAKLSSRERDRILQSMSEGFPPEYRQVLERYYRRLAEEKTIKPGATASDAAMPRNP